MLLKHQEKSGMEMSPEYRKALQDLIKCEIRALTQRLAETGEECLVLTASIQDKSFSQFGSKKGEGFLGEKVHIQEQFLDFCAKVPDSLILQTQGDSTAHVAADVDETDQSLRPVALYRNYLPATEADKDRDRINREHLTQRASPPPPIYSSSKPHLPSGSQGQDQPILHTRNIAGIKKPQETRLHNQDNADKSLQKSSSEKFDCTKSKKVNNTIFLTAEYFEKDKSASMLGKLSKDGAFVDLSHFGTEHFGSDVHMNRHQCSLCGKVFRQREGLKLHMRVHTGERPYICEFCGKIFSRKFVYTVHLRVHSGVRPYMCDICQKTFMYKTSWFRHKKQTSCYYYGRKETGLKVHVSNDKDRKEELKDQSGIMDWTEVENGHPIIHALGDEIENQLDTGSKNIATGEKEILKIDQHQFGLFTENGKGVDSLDTEKNLINQNLGITRLDHNQKAFQITLGLQNKNSGETAEIQNLAKLWKMCSTVGSQVTSTQSNDVNILGSARRFTDQEEICEQSWIEEQNTAQRETIRLKNSDGLGGDIIKIEVEEGIREDCVVIEDSDSQEVKMENVELPIREKSQENNLRNSENNEINSFLDCYSAKQTIERSGRASVSLQKYPRSLEEINRQSFSHDEYNTVVPLYPMTFSDHSHTSKTTREFDQHQFTTVGVSSSKGEVVRLDFSGELSSQSQNGNFSRGDFENRRNNSKSENSCQSLNTMPSSESTTIRHISRNTHSQNTSQTNSLNAQNLIKVDTDPKNPGQRIYVCILCGYGSMRKCDVEKHTRTHTGERPYCCQVCGKAFVSCSAYNVHCRIHSGVKPYKCDLCSKAFVDRSAQLRHLRCFHGLKPYKCPDCPQMFNTKAECDTHHFTHATNYNGDSTKKITVAGQTVNSKHNPTVITSESQTIDIAAIETNSPEIMPRATLATDAEFSPNQTVHVSATEDADFMKDDTQLLKCMICDVNFTSEESLQSHASVHGEEKSTFSCEECGQFFSTSITLEEHQQSHIDRKPFVCATCGKAFSDNLAWKRHKDRHAGIRPSRGYSGKSQISHGATFATTHEGTLVKMHQAQGRWQVKRQNVHYYDKIPENNQNWCDICSKQFSCKFSYIRHRRIHTGEKPYVCNTCGKAYSDGSAWIKHTRTHTGIKPYQCETCGKQFYDKRTCRVHIESHLRKKRGMSHRDMQQSRTVAKAEESVKLERRGLGNSEIEKPEKDDQHETLDTSLSGDLEAFFMPVPDMAELDLATQSNSENLETSNVSSLVISDVKGSFNSDNLETFTDDNAMVIQKTSTSIAHPITSLTKAVKIRKISTQNLSTPSLHERLGRTTGEKSCRCKHCGKILATKHSLERHVRLHTGEKPFSCNVCGKKFSDNSVCVKHIRQHSLANDSSADIQDGLVSSRYKCGICQKMFSSQIACDNHATFCYGIQVSPDDFSVESMENSEIFVPASGSNSVLSLNEELFKCPRCGKIFADKSACMNHLSLHCGKTVE